MEQTKKRKRRGPWRGVMAGESRMRRIMTFALLAIVAAAQTFLQMGFIGIGSSGEYICYVMAILVPITLTALLLGKWQGMGMGFFSGSVLLLHSKFQPLDLYERYLVTPLNSVVIFTFLGFLIGALFALASRSRSKGWVRMIKMASTTIVSAVAASMVTSDTPSWAWLGSSPLMICFAMGMA